MNGLAKSFFTKIEHMGGGIYLKSFSLIYNPRRMLCDQVELSTSEPVYDSGQCGGRCFLEAYQECVLSLSRKTDEYKIRFRVKIVFPCLIDDSEVSLLLSFVIWKHSIYLSLFQIFTVVVFDAQRELM